MAVDLKLFKVGTDKAFKVGGSVAGYKPFFPTNISDLIFWHDASDIADFSFSSGSLISQWNDKSGNGNHLTQAVTTSQLTYDATNKAAESLADNTNNFHMSTNLDKTYSGTEKTLIIQLEMSGTITSQPTFFKTTDNALNTGWVNSGTSLYSFAGSGDIRFTKTRPFTKITLLYEFNSGASTIYENNVLKASGNNGSLVFSNNIILLSQTGGVQRFKGKIYKFLGYDRLLTTTERNDLYNKYLSV